jgi:hypothetical protein
MTADTFDLILDEIERCVAPIWASESTTARPVTVDDSGTCGFIFTGERKLLVTAHHVLRAFRTKRAAFPAAVLAINLGPGCTVALGEPEVVDEHEELDVAILSFPDLDQRTGHNKRYFPIRIWPIASVRRGNAIALIGFPGALRRTTETFGSYEPVGFGMVVSSASDQSIVLADESGTFRTVSRHGTVSDVVRLGGFSGSPAFLVDPAGPQIVGVFRAGPNGDGSATGVVVFLSPIKYLRPDGTLDRSLLPLFVPRRDCADRSDG